MSERPSESPSPAADAGDAGGSVGSLTALPPTRGVPILGYLLAAGGSLLFSSKAIVIKLAYAEGISSETLLMLRMGLSFPLYAIVGLYLLGRRIGDRLEIPKPNLLLRAAGVGIVGYWLASYTDFLGLQYISAHFERLILFTYPSFVVLFGALFFRQPVRWVTMVALAISYAGLAVIFLSHHEPGSGRATVTGVLLVLSAAMAFAAYQLLAKRPIDALGSRLFTCVAMIGATVPTTLQFLIARPMSELHVTPLVLGYGLILAIGATILPTFMLNAALQRITAQANGVIGTLSPIGTILLAVLILKETLTPSDLAGTALVLLGVGWFTLADRKAKG